MPEMHLYRLNGSGSPVKSGVSGDTNKLPSKRAMEILCILSVIVIPGIWALLTFDKLAVSSEGWYFTYSDMIRSGMVPYRDFELLFPPLYTYLHVAVTSVFGDALLPFRVIGVFVFIGTTVVAYFIFRQLFPSWIAATAAIVSIFVMNSELQIVAYDYSRFFDLFNYLAFFFLLRTIVRSHRKEPVNADLHLFLAGAFAAVALLFRQSSGAIAAVYFAVFLLLLFFLVKNSGLERRNLRSFFIGLAVPILITAVLLALAGALIPFIEMVFMGGTKGSILSMLFNWIPRTFETFTGEVTKVLLLTACLAAFIVFMLLRKNSDKEAAGGPADFLIYSAFAAVIAILLVALFFSPEYSLRVLSHRLNLLEAMFILNLAIALTIMIRIAVKFMSKKPITTTEISYLFFCGFIFALGFGSGTSNVLTLAQSALNFGFIVAILLNEIEKIPRPVLKTGLKVTAMAFVIFLFTTSVSVKVLTPYYWWNAGAEPYANAVYGTDIYYFGGIRLTAEEKFVYEDFVGLADLYLGDGDEMYCYSQIGMFYTLAGKVPTVKAPIPWFDVARDRTVIADLEYLKANNPKMIVFNDHGWYAVEAHESLFRDGHESGQRFMYEWLLYCRDDPGSGYTVVAHYQMHFYKGVHTDIYVMCLV